MLGSCMNILLDTQSKSVTRQLELDIRNLLVSDNVKQGNKLLPERKLAKKYNLSCGSVRKVMARLVDEGLLERNGRRGTQICVQTTKSRTISFSFFSSLDFSDMGTAQYLNDIYRGMEQEAIGLGWDIALQIGNALKEKLAVLKNNQSHWADGVILGGTNMPGMISDLVKTSIPFVVIDYPNKIQGVNSIYPDNINGGYMAVSHLREMGHEKIGFVYPLFGSETEMQEGIKSRFFGYQDAMSKTGKPLDGKLGVGINVGTNFKLSATGENTLKEYLASPERPTAIFVASDSIVPEFYRVSQELKIKIPEDLSIVGFEGISFGESFPLALTSVHVDRMMMGKLAIRRLKAIFDGEVFPVSQIIPVKLIVRNSTK